MFPRKNRRNMTEIVSYIKDLISLKVGNSPVKDSQVADELEITTNKLAACKKRDSIPYEDLTYYCQKNNLSLDDMLFQKRFE